MIISSQWVRFAHQGLVFSTDPPLMIDLAHYKRINHEFHRKTGIIGCVHRLNEMNLEPRDIIGVFWLRDIAKLFETCKNDIRLHIVTNINPGLTVNRYVEGSYGFYLADGDKDPNLELRFPPEIVAHLYSELNHFIRRSNICF